MRIKPALAAVLGVAGLVGLGTLPAKALPDAATPTLLGVGLGAEAGVAAPRVGNNGIPYYAYVTVGALRTLAVKGELLGGGSRLSMKNAALQISVLPLPFTNIVVEPGVTWFDNSAGPSLGLRGTGSLPIVKLHITGYARAEYVNSRTTTEVGAGLDYPIASLLRLSVSAIQFNGAYEPAGTLFLVGLKTRLGI